MIYGVEYVLLQSSNPRVRTMIEDMLRCQGAKEHQIKEAMVQYGEGDGPPEQWCIWYRGYIKNRGTKDAVKVKYRFDVPAGTITSLPKLPPDQLLRYLAGPKPWDQFESIAIDDTFDVNYLKAGEMKRVCGMVAGGRFKDKSPQEIYQKVLKGIQAKVESFASEP